MTEPAIDHPDWCTPERCTAAHDGSHRSTPALRTHRGARVSAWLEQFPGREVNQVLSVTYAGLAAPTVYLPLDVAELVGDDIKSQVRAGRTA